MNKVTETINMRDGNDTSLKPILPILFFNKLMKIAEQQYSAQRGSVKNV
jgi:hypothetical protein